MVDVRVKVGKRVNVYGDYTLKFTGVVKKIDTKNKQMTIELPDGTEKIINWLEFIVVITPFIDKIFDFISRTIKRFR